MPELPDITVYIECLIRRIAGRRLETIRIANPFVLRSVDPPIEDLYGVTVTGCERIGKRIVIGMENDLFLVIHLMISGRLKWTPREETQPRPARKKATASAAPGAAPPIPAKLGLAAFDFETGTLLLTEASKQKRASIKVIRGRSALRDLDPGGIEVLEADVSVFRTALKRENHTLKRSLTDPRLFSGIGNAYSDEILHRARLSPVRLTSQLSDAEIAILYNSCRDVLVEWTERLRADAGEGFPEKVTAFRDEMAVHGKFRKPCPDCGSPVQRIVHAENETNYCVRCQTGGRLLADRALSRLLRKDWPRTLEELEEGEPAGS